MKTTTVRSTHYTAQPSCLNDVIFTLVVNPHLILCSCSDESDEEETPPPKKAAKPAAKAKAPAAKEESDDDEDDGV